MQIEYDIDKDTKNRVKHGISLERAVDLDIESAVIEPAEGVFSEPRFVATGYLEERLYILVFTPRTDKMRIISLRKANKRERKKYDTKKAIY